MTDELTRQVLEALKRLDKRLDKVEGNMATKDDLKGMATKDDITSLHKEMVTRFAEVDTRFDGLEDEVRIIREQTARVSELEPVVKELQQRMGHCELDIEVIKKQLVKA